MKNLDKTATPEPRPNRTPNCMTVLRIRLKIMKKIKF